LHSDDYITTSNYSCNNNNNLLGTFQYASLTALVAIRKPTKYRNTIQNQYKYTKTKHYTDKTEPYGRRKAI
jgi:hypothetical protein